MLDVRPKPLVLVMVPDDQPLPDGDNLLIETEAELNALLGRDESAPH